MVVVVGALSTAAAVSAAAAPAAQGSLGNFTAVASAEGTRTTVLASGAVLTDTVADAGSPVAQAQLDSLGGSAAFGSVLYPGDLVVTAPGLVAGATGGKANLPAYPLIASASTNGAPSSKMDAPGSSAQADASPTHATGRSTNGSSTQAGGTATVTSKADAVVDDAGSVSVTAGSDITSFTVGPLTLGSVQSTARAVLSTDGRVTKAATFDASAATVAGAPVTITPKGLNASAPLQSILDRAGISVRYLDQQETDGGIISAGLAVTKRQDLPGTITPVAVVYTFGRTAANVSGQAGDSAGDATSTIAPSSGPTTTGSSSAGTPVAKSFAPQSAPAAAPARASVTSASPKSAAAREIGRFDTKAFYLVLVVAALLGGMAVEFIRHFGVRLLWT
jgi:hypothetical protein